MVDTTPHKLPVQLESHMDDKEFDLFGDVWFTLASGLISGAALY